MNQNVKVAFVNGELQFSFKLENGDILVCNYNEAKSVLDKIEKGELKILSMEL